jgi:hypothetical protein
MAAEDAPDGEGRPPFLGTWNRVYVLVLGSLVAVIALLSLVSALYE